MYFDLFIIFIFLEVKLTHQNCH